MNNVTREGFIDWAKIRRVQANAKKINEYIVAPGDLLFNHTNSPDLVGKCAVFPGYEEPVTYSNHFLRLRPNLGRVDPGFLFRWIAQLWGHGKFKGMCKQWVNQATVSKEQLLSLSIPLPPLPEQRRIAAILDQADAMRAKRRAAVAKLDTLAQSIFIEMFGDQSRNPMAWPLASLGTFIVNGPQNGLYKPADRYGEGTPILRIDGFYAGQISNQNEFKRVRLESDEKMTYALTEGDIVINRVNSPEYLGKCALIPALKEITVFESNMMRLAVDASRLHPTYLVTALQGPSIKAQIKTRAKHAINQSSINQKDVQGFTLPIPPIDLQRRFAEHLCMLTIVNEQHRASLSRLNALFASLQHRAFRGEL